MTKTEGQQPGAAAPKPKVSARQPKKKPTPKTEKKSPNTTQQKKPKEKKKEKKEKKKDQKQKKKKKSQSESSSSSDSQDAKSLVVSVGLDNPFLAQNQQKRVLPGQLRAAVNLENYTLRLLADERPDMDTSQLTEVEAGIMDTYLKGRTELISGDCLYTEDNHDEEERSFTRYEIQLKYNEGRYSAVYLALRSRCVKNELVQDESFFLVKMALRKCSARSAEMLRNEAKILEEVGNKRLEQKKMPFTPIRLDHGKVCEMPFVVMNLLDRNLAKIREDCGGKFSLQTGLQAAIECLNTMADLHGRNYVHRDIKPSNFCAGVAEFGHKLFIIDFGDTIKKSQVPQPRLGTPDGLTLPYWSLEAHQAGTISQRGDFESWFYLTLELLAPREFAWSKDTRVTDAEDKKRKFWQDYRQLLAGNKTLLAVAELLATRKEVSFPKDHMAVKQKLAEALEQTTRGSKFVVDWMRPQQQQQSQMTPGPKSGHGSGAGKK